MKSKSHILLPTMPSNAPAEIVDWMRGVQQKLQEISNNAAVDVGSGTVNNADTVDTYHASPTPTASTIPVADSSGKLNSGWLPNDIYTSYSPYYVQSSAPSSPYIGWLWYNTTTNKLYKYSGTGWIEIKWQEIVKSTPEWQAGYLQINGSTGMLQIADGQTTPTWRDCYPLVGADTIYIVDATQYYFLIKKCVINANALRIVFTPKMVSYFKIYREPYSGDRELTISGIAGSGTRFGHYAITTTGHGMENYSITKHLIASNSNNVSVFNIVLRGAMSYAVTNEYFNDGSRYGIYHYSAHLSIATTSYYLGTLNSTAKLIIEKVGVYAI